MSNRLEEVKNNAVFLTDNDGDFVDIIQLHVDDYAYLYERVKELEKELKSTITKKNRHLKTKDKLIKRLEWKAMIHERGHADVYAQLYELRESLKGESE